MQPLWGAAPQQIFSVIARVTNSEIFFPNPPPCKEGPPSTHFRSSPQIYNRDCVHRLRVMHSAGETAKTAIQNTDGVWRFSGDHLLQGAHWQRLLQHEHTDWYIERQILYIQTNHLKRLVYSDLSISCKHGVLVGLVWGSAAARRCPTFIRWIGWTLAMTLSWW